MISSPLLFPLSATNHSENHGRAPLPVGPRARANGTTFAAAIGVSARQRRSGALGYRRSTAAAPRPAIPTSHRRKLDRSPARSGPREGRLFPRWTETGGTARAERILSQTPLGAKTALLRNARMTSARLSMTTRWPERGGREWWYVVVVDGMCHVSCVAFWNDRKRLAGGATCQITRGRAL